MNHSVVAGVTLAAVAAVASAQEDRKAEVASPSRDTQEREGRGAVCSGADPGRDRPRRRGGRRRSPVPPSATRRLRSARTPPRRWAMSGRPQGPRLADLLRGPEGPRLASPSGCGRLVGADRLPEAEPALKAASKDRQKAVAEAANRSLKRLKDAAKGEEEVGGRLTLDRRRTPGDRFDGHAGAARLPRWKHG